MVSMSSKPVDSYRNNNAPIQTSHNPPLSRPASNAIQKRIHCICPTVMKSVTLFFYLVYGVREKLFQIFLKPFHV